MMTSEPSQKAGKSTSSVKPSTELMRLSKSLSSGSLQVSSSTSTWNVFLDNGRLHYAYNSSQSIECIKHSIRQLKIDQSDAIKKLLSSKSHDCSAEEVIKELHEQNLLSPDAIAGLVSDLSSQAFESLMWLRKADLSWQPDVKPDPDSLLAQIPLEFSDTEKTIQHHQCRIGMWQQLSPVIWSPYQRPYIFDYYGVFKQAVDAGRLSQKLYDSLNRLLKGLSIRQLAPLLSQDEIKVAQFLVPFAKKGAIFLREPEPPFDRLPRIPEYASSDDSSSGAPLQLDGNAQSKKRKIACIDDSPTILDEIDRLLGNEGYDVVKIDDPVKASGLLFRIKPELILMDVTMPGINGYKLCGLLRGSVLFKDTPIVMVTGNKGLIDKARAKVSGATDYLTKPFTRDSLVNIVEKHLKVPD